jgi:TrpR-related protein YerC/YecD
MRRKFSFTLMIYCDKMSKNLTKKELSKVKKTPKESSDLLYESILKLQTVEECRNFFQDLCTVSELCAMEQRIEVAMYLNEGMIYKTSWSAPGQAVPPSAG